MGQLLILFSNDLSTSKDSFHLPFVLFLKQTLPYWYIKIFLLLYHTQILESKNHAMLEGDKIALNPVWIFG